MTPSVGKVTLCRLIHLKNTVRCCSPWPTACWAARWRRKTSCRRRTGYRATPPASIRTLKSFLTTIVHHLCIDHLRSAQAREKTTSAPGCPSRSLRALAQRRCRRCTRLPTGSRFRWLFLLFESLSPLERAVFLLREVFDYEYAEIAQITGRGETAAANCSAVQKHIREHRPRFPASPEARENGWSIHASLLGRRH